MTLTEADKSRVMSYVSVDDGCWIWTGGKNSRGYGKIKIQGEWFYATRLIWEMLIGRIELGMFMCHHCDNPACVNPSHLFPGTHTDNMHDMIRKGRSGSGKFYRNKTHCPSGHEYTKENTAIYDGRRQCRICNKEKGRERYRRMKLARENGNGK